MTCRVKLPSCKYRFLVFCAYNFFYVLYMMGYTPQSLYLATLITFCVMNTFVLVIHRKVLLRNIRELKLGLGYVGIFLIISIFTQIINFDFEFYMVEGIVRIALPIINAFLFVNTVKEKDQKYFFNVLLSRFIIHFIWQNYSYINIQGLNSISWSSSNSEMESSLAHDFIIMEMYYLYKRDNKKAFLCLIFCMFSMKRLSFILAPFLYVIAKRIPVNKLVKEKYLILLKIFAILSPFIILFLYSNTSQQWIKSNFNIDLNSVMTGRPAIYNTLTNNISYYNGYGSINNFLSSFVMNQFGTTWNGVLHNDFLRIYLETTIVGVIALANNLVELSKKEYWHFLMILYLIFVAATSHILNYFSVWITLYMVIMSSRKQSSYSREDLD